MNRLFWWAGGASILALVTVPAWALVSQRDDDVGSLEPLRIARASAPVETVVGGGLELPKVVVRSGRLADQAAPNRGRIPRRLRIDAIGGLCAHRAGRGDARNHAGTSRCGHGRLVSVRWTPRKSGSTLLLAHVSSGTQGPGAFFLLPELAPRDDVIVEMRTGSSAAYRVIARRSYAKEAVPARLFRRIGPEVLILVTCGGRFSEASGRYQDNVVVYAVPRG